MNDFRSYLTNVANLLSQENISFDIDDIETAFFDPESRKITLPSYSFNTKSIIVNERIVVHETGHALFTPKDLFTRHPEYNTDLVNIIEDVRIENLLKEKFSGVGKLMYEGFLKILELFKEQTGIDCLDEEHSSYLIDRINLYFKSNFYHLVLFKEEEQEVLSDLKALREVEDVYKIIDKILLLEDQKEQEEKLKKLKDLFGKIVSSEMKDNSISTDNQKEEEEDDSELSTERKSILSKQIMDNSICLKQEQFLKDQKDQGKNKSIVFSPAPPFLISEEDFWKVIPSDILNLNQEKIEELFSDIEKNASSLSSEFHRKKNAKNFREITNTKTGSLDISRVSKYKTSTDLFEDVKKFKRQKNHEVVILLDWSSSIHHNLLQLAIQTAILFYFCKKNSINCRVLAFSASTHAIHKFVKPGTRVNSRVFVRNFNETNSTNENKVITNNPFVWFEFLNSGGNLKMKVKRFLSLIYKVSSSYWYAIDNLKFLELSSTPLYHSLLKIGPLLKSVSGRDKITNLIIITDGASDKLQFEKAISSEKNFRGITTIFDLESKKIFKNIKLYNHESTRDFLFDRLKMIIPGLRILHIHIADNVRECASTEGMLAGISIWIKDQISYNLKKQGFAFIKYKNFSSLRYIQKFNNSVEEKTKLLNDTTQVTSKVSSLGILRSLNSSLSKKIFQKIAEVIG